MNCSQAIPEEIGQKGKQRQKTNESHLVQHSHESIMGPRVVLPDFKNKWNSKTFSAGRVFLEAPPSFAPGRKSKLPIRVVSGVEDCRVQFVSDTRGKISASLRMKK